ncbi:hypothetical protein COW06_01435 [Candidatus Gracilibacteria bacterium CG12_big_fil_rev_8_21_14_0_65_38_15]|nr:MAG: hypothetical protein COW68_01735 [Candidatus Gracilibacteria bacterium CG18_big_fil_WC_8_21_14_2_50_38_16]PIQ41905.1 MAG: hypothetical protein COW06_01435 [Candidatus Gracilibacteria bacterium CG12_big_fil_rev_8_21_14_0_65_38_15]PIZ01736.1 MAG: hypothetical protein COY60_01990 [Candidatus Gracilibacteria bacterium CG_4_10_14_0_8_um_filter_38_28]
MIFPTDCADIIQKDKKIKILRLTEGLVFELKLFHAKYKSFDYARKKKKKEYWRIRFIVACLRYHEVFI